MSKDLLKRFPMICFGISFLLVMLLGCGKSIRNSDRQNRLGFGPNISARFINLPSPEPGHGMLVFVAEMRYADLQFVKTNDGYTAEVELTFSLQEKASPKQVRLVDRQRKIDLKNFAETVDRDQVLRVVEQMVVPVGEYMASVVVSDRYAKSRDLFSQRLRVNDFLSGLHLVQPILTWDSLMTFQPDAMIPLRQRRFTKNFYALLVIGGLQAGREMALQYELQDNEGKRLFEQSLLFPAPAPVAYASLLIPFAKLSIGTTILKVTVEQNGARAEASLPIYANVGFSPKQGQSLTTLIDPMRYIMEGKDWQVLKEAGPDERLKIFKEFWDARQPLKGEPLKSDEENPLLAEFFLRVEEANWRFDWTRLEGWRTDRGRIFIIYGEPDSIQRQYDQRRQTTFEIWTYRELGRQFIFQEYNNDGDFRLFS
ncbi:MAG: GWxTD domain-containing protein, partial [bacterium]